MMIRVRGRLKIMGMRKLRFDQGLNEAQIIRLHRELVAPVSVHDIMAGHDVLDEVAEYTLDVMIAEFQPDTALMCIALCAAHVAEIHASQLPIAGTLGFEAGRIVHEYGPLWLAHADRQLTAADEGRVIDLLEQMPEDLESMADLLDTLRSYMVAGSDTDKICEILSQNARGFMDYLENQAQQERESLHKSMLETLEVRDNVITFPVMAQRAARAH
jgi:hypothetical protein